MGYKQGQNGYLATVGDSQAAGVDLGPELVSEARVLIARADAQCGHTAEKILELPIPSGALVAARQHTAKAMAERLLPTDATTSLPTLPELEFEPANQAEVFLLEDLKDHLATGRSLAQRNHAEGRPAAEIASLAAALAKARHCLRAFAKEQSVSWGPSCEKLLEETASSLSREAATPYLDAVGAALLEARRSGHWDRVMQLMEVVVRIAPSGGRVVQAVRDLETILAYRSNTEDPGAEAARARLEAVKSILAKAVQLTERNSIGMQLVRIPWERRHFLMGAHEVTIGQVLQWLNETRPDHVSAWIEIDQKWCPIVRNAEGNGFSVRGGERGLGQTPEQPMVGISVYGAEEFCRWLSKREGRKYGLPTVEGWAFACGAVAEDAPWHWGCEAERADDYAWYAANSGRETHPVGGKRPNRWGLFDTAGNCWEWIPYSHNYHSGKRVYSTCYVVGGGWDSGVKDCRIGSTRARSTGHVYPSREKMQGAPALGFRVVVWL